MADGPDYTQILSNDPVYQQALAAYNAAQQAALSQWNYLRGQALTQYNGNDGTFARLFDQNRLNRQGILGNLGGRGLDHSGELSYENQLEEKRYGQARLDATTQLQQYLNQVAQGFAGAVGSAQQSLLGAAQDAYSRGIGLWGTLHPPGSVGPAAAAPVPQPTRPTFAPVAAQQNPFNPAAQGPGSSSMFQPRPAAPSRQPVSVFANARRLAY